ncbi:glycosyltransferase family 4 protein [Ligilactobacillus sp. LYQ139]|uniref:glycosyltransferase family 4 protein n=1 Tax=Ligilactobacillus sp. LYQ139 TaxID=3378800 RepID=UPI003851AEE1
MPRIIVTLLITALIATLLTPLVRKIAQRIGALDRPNARRVNQVPMPTMGGLAIFIAFAVANFCLLRDQYPGRQLTWLFVAECVIIITGMLDDLFELRPFQKLIGITIAAVITYCAGIRMAMVTLPFTGEVHLHWLSLPATLVWIIAITNALNLIDGLDGLATGVACIALTTSALIGYFFLGTANIFVSIMMLVLVAAMLGFLPYNFYPAKIYLGDTGSLFIGFMIAVFSLYGLKNATIISVIIPVIILGVPITDTVSAILRRALNKKPIMQADKHHLHHRLMAMGLSHRQTVLVIYGIALIFSLISLLYALSSFWGALILTVAVLLGVELFVEAIGLVGSHRQPLLDLIRIIVLREEPQDGRRH